MPCILFDNFYGLVEEAQWFLEYLMEHKDDPETFRILLNLHNISKQDLLRIGWKASLFGDHSMHGVEGVRFYTKLKTITARWPKSIKSGPEFIMPTN